MVPEKIQDQSFCIFHAIEENSLSFFISFLLVSCTFYGADFHLVSFPTQMQQHLSKRIQRCSCVLSSFQILPVRFGHLIETKCLMYAGQEQEQLVNITLTLQYKLHFHYFPPLSLSIGC